MSAASVRLSRSYTRARRYPWTLGKIGDFTLPFGPYTPAQLIVGAGGAWVLIKTFALWSFLGPVPPVAWLAAVWALRGTTIGGRSPLYAAVGYLKFFSQSSTGRLNGRPARAAQQHLLFGGFLVEETTPASAVAVLLPESGRKGGRGRVAVRRAKESKGQVGSGGGRVCPAPTALQQLLGAKAGVGS
ncbi:MULTISPECIES: hypothetical protein [unclassified Streptomyces]|uniref:hypothetical protein n=1 Tax=unclassified Streptomyces TaxID=2593676 RepID=UPI002DD819C0|nr:hypothetical protein [Streptomyces sp. NBC_01766]WSC24915.1 conjugal transfer protein [Streptomyces sp. NBC_01766]